MKKDSQDNDLVIHHSAREKAKKEGDIKMQKFLEEHKLKQQLEGKYVIPKWVTKIRIKDATKVADKEPVVFIRDVDFAVKKECSFITGQPKAGKTTLSSFIIATSLMKKIPEDFDSLGIRSTYCNDKPIVYFDTEQADNGSAFLLKRINKLLGKKENYCPDNLWILNSRLLPKSGLQETLKGLRM